MVMEPLQPMLQHLEEKIKKTVLAHTGSSSGTWQDMFHRMNCDTVLSAYCDCSVIKGRFHLGVCIVGAETYKLYGRTISTQSPELTIVGELEALIYAIECAQEFIINGRYETIKSITLFTDVDHIQRLLRSKTRKTHQPIINSVQRLNKYKKEFSMICPGALIHISYLGNPAQQGNIYYKTAHKVAGKFGRFYSH